jgi:hypothetical protein
MKTSELTGALLDYWVARANGWTRSASAWVDDHGVEQFAPAPCYDPSHDWGLAGQIIERERGRISPEMMESDRPVVYVASMGTGLNRYQCFGPTHLIAAMRSFVGSQFGAEVPDTLPPL